MIALHKLTGAKICIAHTSAGETLAEKEKEILQGDSFFVETCPHYMEFTRDRMCGKDGELYTMAMNIVPKHPTLENFVELPNPQEREMGLRRQLP